MNLWHLYFFGLYLKWLQSFKFQQWEFTECKASKIPFTLIHAMPIDRVIDLNGG